LVLPDWPLLPAKSSSNDCPLRAELFGPRALHSFSWPRWASLRKCTCVSSLESAETGTSTVTSRLIRLTVSRRSHGNATTSVRSVPAFGASTISLTPAATWIGGEHWPASTDSEYVAPAASVTVKLYVPAASGSHQPSRSFLQTSR